MICLFAQQVPTTIHDLSAELAAEVPDLPPMPEMPNVPTDSTAQGSLSTQVAGENAVPTQAAPGIQPQATAGGAGEAGRIAQAQSSLFAATRLERLKIQLITETGASAGDVSADSPELAFP